MLPESQQNPTQSAFPWWKTILLVFVSLGIGAVAIPHESFWMDEGGPAFKSLLPTLGDWWKMTLQLRGSDVQMPVYMASLWGWEKIMGNTEFALRAINLPFLVIMVLALRNVRFWPLVCLTSPFVLYYVGELRPYAMQMAAGACAAAAIGRVIRSRAGEFDGLLAVLGSALFLCACSLTAVVWAGGLMLGMLVIRPDWLKTKGFWKRCLIYLPAGLAVGGFYAFTLIEGYRATASGGGGLLSLLFGFYEMAGLLGLGPSRNELRASPMALLAQLPWLLPAAGCLFAAWSFGLREWLRNTPRRVAVGVALAVGTPVVILAVVGWLADFRVLGRHMSPAMPAVLLPICVCLAHATVSRPKLVIGTLAILLSLASAASLRFAGKHARDDYRTATRLAIEALTRNQSVLWQADMNTPRYYAFRAGGWPYVNAIQVLESNPPSGFMFADRIFINRPDIGYKNRNHRETMKQAAFDLESSLTGFEVWKNRYTSAP
ncbi:MAG: hypothetical protein V4689_14325 [Verrucomicrobiota bacterium]